MMTMNYIAMNNTYEPEWMRAERYDYCENDTYTKPDFFNEIADFFKRFLHW